MGVGEKNREQGTDFRSAQIEANLNAYAAVGVKLLSGDQQSSNVDAGGDPAVVRSLCFGKRNIRLADTSQCKGIVFMATYLLERHINISVECRGSLVVVLNRQVFD